MSQKIYGDLEIKRHVGIGGDLEIKGSSSGSTKIKAPSSGDSVVYTLPSNDGEKGDILASDGSGNLTWINSQPFAGTYLSAVTTDTTLTGSGTALDPLKVAVPVLSTDITNWNAKLGDSFESVSKNLKAYPYTLNYTGSNLTSIVYNLGSGNFITKTLNYTTNQLTSVVLSGTLPSGVLTTKTLSYSSGILNSISYS